jgi:GGDEF domain-containing protein
MQVGPPRPRRPRPVVDAPIDALLRRAEDLVKGWLLTLLEQAPLGEAPAILAVDLQADGPRICDAVLRALADDEDLGRVGRGGALEPLVSRTGELVGAQSAEQTARAVETLRAVIWRALREELPRADPDQVSELAERLALVVEQVRGAALRRCQGDTEVEGSQDLGPLWAGPLKDEIARAERLGARLALLLVELDEAERVIAVEPPSEAEAIFSRFAETVRSAVRREDGFALETAARAWIVARDVDRVGALALGARIAGSIRAADPWRGAPITVSVGVAALGEDGRDAAALTEAAEESKYAADASGRPIAQAEPGQAPGDPPRESGPRLVR